MKKVLYQVRFLQHSFQHPPKLHTVSIIKPLIQSIRELSLHGSARAWPWNCDNLRNPVIRCPQTLPTTSLFMMKGFSC